MPKPGNADRCENCDYFEGPRRAPEGVDVSRDLNGVYSSGVCLRFPATVAKKPDGWCGEFNDKRTRS